MTSRAVLYSAFVALLGSGCGARSALREDGSSSNDSSVPAMDTSVPDALEELVRDLTIPEDGPAEDGPEVLPPPPPPPLPPPPPPPPRCGDGRLDPGEACDLGAENRLLPAFGLSQPGVAEEAVTPVARPTDAAGFYDYTSASAHTGFEAVGLCNLFLYVDTRSNVLGLLLFAGRDALGGPSQPDSAFDGTLRGVPPGARLVVSDDGTEFTRTSLTDWAGRWSFNDNTDGGALDGLPWDSSWRITVEVTFLRGVSVWRYQDNVRGARPLDPSRAAVLVHRTGPSSCRPDCQLPRCGDGFTDGGERCDDGNTADGDGCSRDCQRILR